MTDRIPLDQISFEDETYRISEELFSEKLQASLLEVGQINPVILIGQQESRMTIVAGFRRLWALRRIGREDALACVEAADRCEPLDAFRLGLWDNLAHRQLSPLEVARALHVLKVTCGLSSDVLTDKYLPALGLAPNRKVLQIYLRLNTLQPGLRRLINESRLTLHSAERLALAGPELQDKIAVVLSRVRLSASLQRQVLDLVDEHARMRNTNPAEVLDDPEIAALLDDGGLSTFQRGERLHDLLFRRSHLRLSAARARFEAEKKKLGLPANIRISTDPYFEYPGIRVEFDASSPEGFGETIEALRRASRAPELGELFEETQ